MSDVVIRVENLSKHYRLGAIGGATLREDMQRWWAQLRGRPDPLAPMGGRGNPSTTDLWALRDVSFEAKRGEVLGVIGRNGAGKSTLLKILSRTTSPTRGRALAKGHIGSLLEVGTGFHPELSGRENIYLSGAILGMSKESIRGRLEEIIDFSGISRHIDTPVKRYSSGMYVRLGFSVAAHLQPEVLIVDEVLAVGDSGFQFQCATKMREISKSGCTILFVSHNLQTIQNLCSRVIYLGGGSVKFDGMTSHAISLYSKDSQPRGNSEITERTDREGLGRIKITQVDVTSECGFMTGGDVNVSIRYESSDADILPSEFGISLWTAQEVRVVSISTNLTGGVPVGTGQQGTAVCGLPRVPLVHGKYIINAFVSSSQGIEDYLVCVREIYLEPADIYGHGQVVDPAWGVLALDHKWNFGVQ